MNCREAEKLLDGYFDGELDGDAMREAALHVAHCGSCEAELAGRERVQGLLRGSVADAVEDLDVDRIWQGVVAAIDDGPAVARRSAAFWRGPASRGRAADAAALDPGGEWLHRRSRATWSWAAGAALAAGLAGFVAIRGLSGPGSPDRLAGREASGRVVASAEAPASPVARLAQAEAPVTPASGARRGRIAVDSVDFEGHSLAMWSEPETDTTVIWIDEDEPSGTRLR